MVPSSSLHGYEPNLMVPPIFLIFFCSSIISITGFLAFSSNSVLFAPSKPFILANSTTIHCIPRQIPNNGICFSIEYLTASSFPDIPLSPKPPGIRSASNFAIFSLLTLSSALIYSISTFTPCSAAACLRDSLILMYASSSSTYFPIIPMLIFVSSILRESTIRLHSYRSGFLASIFILSSIRSPTFSLLSMSGIS